MDEAGNPVTRLEILDVVWWSRDDSASVVAAAGVVVACFSGDMVDVFEIRRVESNCGDFDKTVAWLEEGQWSVWVDLGFAGTSAFDGAHG